MLSALGLMVGAYLFGLWIPNYPKSSEFPMRGIDVSAHQGEINWKSVAKTGIRFVYLKATEGGDFQDAKFTRNLQEATHAGLMCGAYHFFSLRTPGRVQAENFVKTVPQSIELPPAVDLEYWGNSSVRPLPAAFQVEFRTYVEVIWNHYHQVPLIYVSSDFSDVYLKGYSIENFWLRDILFSPSLDGTKAWMLWQFSERGRVEGIKGYVDLDVFNGTDAKFGALAEKSPSE